MKTLSRISLSALALVLSATLALAAPPDLEGAEPLHSGAWTKKTQKIAGTWSMDKAVVISLLRSAEGAQTYEIPKKVDLDRYRSIAIHCEKYTKLWGAAALSKPKTA